MSSILLRTVPMLCVILCTAPSLHGAILAIDFDTGNLYSANTTNASLTLVAQTGIQELGSLEYHNGMLYGIRVGGSEAMLYRMAPDGTGVGPVGSGMGAGYYYEGALAFSPEGNAYATNRGSSLSPELFQINTATGVATVIGTMTNGSHDINGMVWRNDGMLVGVDRLSNAIVTINPMTADVSVLASIEEVIVGGVGGMVIDAGTVYLATAGPDGTRPGSNSLYRVNINTGALSLVGAFTIGGVPLTGSGISGLAIVPEPASLAMMAIAVFGLFRRRRVR